MRLCLLVATLLSTLANAYEKVPQGRPGTYGSSRGITCPIEIIPGKSIGSIKLGQSKKELEALKMTIKSVEASDLLIVGRNLVHLDKKGLVVTVEAELGDLPSCLHVGDKELTKKMHPFELSRVFKKCQKTSVREGGNIIECDGIDIISGGWGGQQKTPLLRVKNF